MFWAQSFEADTDRPAALAGVRDAVRRDFSSFQVKVIVLEVKSVECIKFA